MASAKQTRDHDFIRKWAESRGGIPTFVKGTAGLLRIDFVEGAESGGREPNLEEVEWERWFEVFDRSGISFLYSPQKESRFFKLVSRDDATGGISPDLGQALAALAHLDAEAAMTYEIAAKNVDSREVRQVLERCGEDHRRHVEALFSALEKQDGRAVERGGKGEKHDSALVLLIATVAPMGTRAILRALVANELLTNATYEGILELVADETLRTLVQSHYDDEQRHMKLLTGLAQREWDEPRSERSSRM